MSAGEESAAPRLGDLTEELLQRNTARIFGLNCNINQMLSFCVCAYAKILTEPKSRFPSYTQRLHKLTSDSSVRHCTTITSTNRNFLDLTLLGLLGELEPEQTVLHRSFNLVLLQSVGHGNLTLERAKTTLRAEVGAFAGIVLALLESRRRARDGEDVAAGVGSRQLVSLDSPASVGEGARAP